MKVNINTSLNINSDKNSQINFIRNMKPFKIISHNQFYLSKLFSQYPILLIGIIAFNLVSCNIDNSTIRIKGSDTEVNLSVDLAEAYYKKNKSLIVSVSGGGSGLGIVSLLNGTADIANSSRTIKKAEVELFSHKGLVLDSFIFAQDAVAFVVSSNIPIDSIDASELGKILSGEYKNWSEICNVNLPINIYGRQSNSGTYVFIKDKLKIDFSPHAKEMNGNSQIIEAIKTDKSGIGYVGASYVKKPNKNIRVVSIYTSEKPTSISPLDADKIAKGLYHFQRPLLQYYIKNQYKKVKPIIDFEKSKKGKNIIVKAGYYPVRDK